MAKITKKAFKTCLTEILGRITEGLGWRALGSLHAASAPVGGRLIAAFVLKGPGGGFEPMEMTPRDEWRSDRPRRPRARRIVGGAALPRDRRTPTAF